MRSISYSDKHVIAANQNIKEGDYWLNKLSGDLVKSIFPYDYIKIGINERCIDALKFRFKGELFLNLMDLSKESDYALHVIKVSGVIALLHKYTGNKDILVGSPIYKQKIQGEFINTVLVLRNQLKNNVTFKELLFQVKQTIVEASGNQNYPLEILLKELNLPVSENEFPLFDILILLENIHEKRNIQFVISNMTFSFLRTDKTIEGILEYNSYLYKKTTIERIISNFENLLKNALFNVDVQLSDLEILSEEEKNQLLFDFNDTKTVYQKDKTVHQLFEEQVEKLPDSIAIVNEDKQLTYMKLSEKANQLARLLRSKGVRRNTNVGIMVERSEAMIIGILGILKAGGAYLPIDCESPQRRVISLLYDCKSSILLANIHSLKKFSFTALQDLQSGGVIFKRNAPRPQILDLDSMPQTDRSLVNYEKYNQYLGEAMVENCISLQVTRGCPFNCLYCHKIWPKGHVLRSAENIFKELQVYYNMGVQRFAFIDDIFNLNIKNSARLFELIIKGGLDIQIFFPNGLRGDLLTEEYIDLIVEAGVTTVALALETASPRLQKLIKKNLNIKKLHENLEYICKKYPHVLTELYTMHGFPTETEEEAMMTLDFLKNLKWIHFPHINILKIYFNTDMAMVALENGIPKEAIVNSENLAFHEIPNTLPFDNSFTNMYQADYLNNYFLSKERLLSVLPHQMRVLTEDNIVKKYSTYFPTEFKKFNDLLQTIGISVDELDADSCLKEGAFSVPGLYRKMKTHFPVKKVWTNALRILLLDLSQSFSHEAHQLNNLVEPPLGLMCLLTYINQQYGSRINGRIAKAMIDFDSYPELRKLLDEFKPDVIGIRTLSYYKDFFHKTVARIREWGITVPIITGGPYATCSYETILQDRHVDLVVLGEGEITFSELIGKILENGGKLPEEEELEKIVGIAYAPGIQKSIHRWGREIIFLDELTELLGKESVEKLENINLANDLVYTIFTSGSTGRPKGVMVEHRNVVRLVKNTNYIEFKEDDKILQTGALDFDASTFEIWGPLLNGSSLYLLSKNQILVPKKLKEAIAKYRISTIWMTAPLFNQMLDVDIEIFKGLENLVVGGESLSPVHIYKVRKRFPQLNVINGYGPTENTTFSLTYKVDREYKKNIPIGKPISNSTAYILNKNNQLLPIGVVGELCVGGDGVARGYMNNPELTKEQFTTNPFVKGEPLYRTGDLAKWLLDGNIEFLGRRDQQVKIRGYRIELGEIESQLLKHEKIKEAVVVAKEIGKKSGTCKNEVGNMEICAYMVSSGDITVSELKDYLKRYLPHFMVPVHFIQLDKIPLNSNGKVNRKLLPDPGLKAEGNYIAPGDEIEEKLVEIWSQELGIELENIGLDSDFFELGGHSLKLVTMIASLHKELEVMVPLEDIFTNPTVRELSRYIKGLAKNGYKCIELVEEKEYYPLSSAQQRMYIQQLIDKTLTNYNVTLFEVLEGELDRRRMEESFSKLIKRHESLRTGFEIINVEPVQKIHKHKDADFEIEYYDSTENGTATTAQIKRDFIRPFSLPQVPILRVGLIKNAKNKHILMIDTHHIIMDGSSMGIFINDFMALYSGQDLTVLKLRYKDFAQWEKNQIRSGKMKAQEVYWLNEFEKQVPVLELPTDYPRPGVRSFEGDRVTFVLDKEETGLLNRIAKEEGATLFMVLLAQFNILLQKLSGQEEITVGTGVAGRRHTDLVQVMGMFVNMLALKNFPEGKKTFKEFLREVKAKTLKAFENQDYQFEVLVEKVGARNAVSRHPLFDVALALQNIGLPEINIPGLTMKPCEYENDASRFDLSLNAIEKDGRIVFKVEYCTKLFKKETVELFIKYFTAIITAVAENRNVRLEDIRVSHHFSNQKINNPQIKFGFQNKNGKNNISTIRRKNEKELFDGT